MCKRANTGGRGAGTSAARIRCFREAVASETVETLRPGERKSLLTRGVLTDSGRLASTPMQQPVLKPVRLQLRELDCRPPATVSMSGYEAVNVTAS